MLLGEGTYGAVITRDSTAVKKFRRLNHLVQECTVLSYLSGCHYVVKLLDFDLAQREIVLELYDNSLRGLLIERTLNREERYSIWHDILSGLIELHDRGITHGDIKPSNILVRYSPLGAVLGDCGFASIDEYSKTDYTAAAYRDPVVSHSWCHDMYSLGILLYELLTGDRIREKLSYKKLAAYVKRSSCQERERTVILSLIQRRHTNRPTARDIMNQFFNQDPRHWVSTLTYTNTLSSSDRRFVRDCLKNWTNELGLNRGLQAYHALADYLSRRSTSTRQYPHYVSVVMFMLSSNFGLGEFNERSMVSLFRKTTKSKAYKILNKLLRDESFVGLFLQPE